MIFYNIVQDESGQSVSIVFSDGSIKTVSEEHPRYSLIREYLLSTPVDELDEGWIRNTSNIVASVGTHLRALSDRVRIGGNTLYFDNDPVDSALSRHIIALSNGEHGGESVTESSIGFVRFLEKLYQNPSEASRESLFTWLRRYNFTITVDGDFVAYKAVRSDGSGGFVSIHSGRALVNGVVHVGQIPNPLGGVIEMPRSSVEDDTAVGCSYGLHAGTFSYASGFLGGYSGAILRVLINPRDVVSVPSDCAFQKLRVSRYSVFDITEVERDETLLSDFEEDDSDYDDDYDDDYEDDYYEDDYEDNYEDYEDDDDYDGDGEYRADGPDPLLGVVHPVQKRGRHAAP